MRLQLHSDRRTLPVIGRLNHLLGGGATVYTLWSPSFRFTYTKDDIEQLSTEIYRFVYLDLKRVKSTPSVYLCVVLL